MGVFFIKTIDPDHKSQLNPGFLARIKHIDKKPVGIYEYTALILYWAPIQRNGGLIQINKKL